MKILITGGSGYLGRRLVQRTVDRYDVRYTFFTKDPLKSPFGVHLDLRDEKTVRDCVESIRPEVVIHTAGSDRSSDSDNLIRSGAENITRAARSVSARLVHLSTDVIFDGRQPPYDETAQPLPLHNYGRSKAAAEDVVSEHANHVIVRTSLIYGLDEMDPAATGLITALRSGKPVKLFTDQRRNPIWVETLARVCLELSQHRHTGVLNVAGRQVLTRAELGLRMLDWWGVENRGTLSFGPSDGEKWPRDCELNLERASRLLRTPLLGVDEVLHKNSKHTQSYGEKPVQTHDENGGGDGEAHPPAEEG